MTPRDFRAWRRKMGLTQEQAAELLGMGRTAVSQYDTGKRRAPAEVIETVPRYIALACAAISHGLAPYGSDEKEGR